MAKLLSKFGRDLAYGFESRTNKKAIQMADWHGISLYSDLSWRSKHSCSGQHAILDSRSNLAAYELLQIVRTVQKSALLFGDLFQLIE